MRRTVVLLASMTLAVVLAGGAALGATRGEQAGGHPGSRPIEPGWVDEPVAARGGGLEAALFGGHWTSVTPGEELRYHNPERVYPSAVAHAARAWNALDARFDGRGVRLIAVSSGANPTVRIDGIRSCGGGGWLGFAQDRPGLPDRLGVNTCALGRQGSKLREHVLAHEMGHHLGSGHQRQRFCGKSIMLRSVPCGRGRVVLTRPGTRDVAWYRSRWVR